MAKTKKQVKVALKKSTSRPQVAARQPGTVGKLLRSLGGLGGSTLGSYVGMPAAGSAAGNSLGAAVSKWLGFGDYSVGTNSIVSKASTGIPMMHKDGQTVVIRHREFIHTVRSTQSFTVQKSFQLNPGNSDTFPWLSTIASSFQEYRFKGIVFHYIPTSGNAISGTSPSLGSVMMQTSYRSNDSAPSSKAELLNEYWSGEAVPSETFAHPIECDPAENPFNVQYVRTGNLPSSDNQLFYDLGVTHLCTQGQLATDNTLGDLWVTYEVELKKPVVSSNVTSRTKYANLTAYTPTNTDIFGGNIVTSGNIALERTANNKLRIPSGSRGSYVVTVMMGVVTTGVTFDRLLTNATSFAIDVDGTTRVFTGSGTSQSPAFAVFGFTVTDSTLPTSFEITLTGGTMGSWTNTDVILTKVAD